RDGWLGDRDDLRTVLVPGRRFPSTLHPVGVEEGDAAVGPLMIHGSAEYALRILDDRTEHPRKALSRRRRTADADEVDVHGIGSFRLCEQCGGIGSAESQTCIDGRTGIDREAEAHRPCRFEGAILA